MKVLHVIDSGGMYGAEVMLLSLMAEQRKAGLTPALASIGKRKEGEKPIEAAAMAQGLPCIKFRFAPGPNLLGALGILRFANRQGYRVLHSHGYKADIFFGFLPASLRRIPIIATLHGWTNTGGDTKLQLYEWLDGKSLSHMDAVVLVSNSMLSHPWLRNCRPQNLHVVTNGIYSSLDAAAKTVDLPSGEIDKSIASFCGSGLKICSIGRLSPEKGYLTLLDAFRCLLNKGIDARLVIIGEGPQRAHLEQKASRLGIASKILLPGYRRNASNYLPLFDIFALPSFTEGMPITLLEAMAAGVPIVASRVGGIPELLMDGKAGLLVAPGNVDQLAASIELLMKNSDLKNRMVNQARSTVRKSYSSGVMAAGYRKIYSLLSS